MTGTMWVRFESSPLLFAWLDHADLWRHELLEEFAIVKNGQGGRSGTVALPEALVEQRPRAFEDLADFRATRCAPQDAELVRFSELAQRVAPIRAVAPGEAPRVVLVVAGRDDRRRSQEICELVCRLERSDVGFRPLRGPGGESLDGFVLRPIRQRAIEELGELPRTVQRLWSGDGRHFVPWGFDLPLLRAYPRLYELGGAEQDPRLRCWLFRDRRPTAWPVTLLTPESDSVVPLVQYVDLAAIEPAASRPQTVPEPSSRSAPRFELRFAPAARRLRTARHTEGRALIRIESEDGHVGRRMLDFLDRAEAGLEEAQYFAHHPDPDDVGPFGLVHHYLLLDHLERDAGLAAVGVTVYREHPWLKEQGLPLFVERGYELRPDPAGLLASAHDDVERFLGALRARLLPAVADGSAGEVDAIALGSDTGAQLGSPVVVALREGRRLAEVAERVLDGFQPKTHTVAARAPGETAHQHAEESHALLARLAESQSAAAQRATAALLARIRSEIGEVQRWAGRTEQEVAGAARFLEAADEKIRGLPAQWMVFVSAVTTLHETAAERHAQWFSKLDGIEAAIATLLNASTELSRNVAQRAAEVADEAQKRSEQVGRSLSLAHTTSREIGKARQRLHGLGNGIETLLRDAGSKLDAVESGLRERRAAADTEMARQVERGEALAREADAVAALETRLAAQRDENDRRETSLRQRRQSVEAAIRAEGERHDRLVHLEQVEIPNLERALDEVRHRIAGLVTARVEQRHAELLRENSDASNRLAGLQVQQGRLEPLRLELKEVKARIRDVKRDIKALELLRDEAIPKALEEQRTLTRDLAALDPDGLQKRIRAIEAQRASTAAQIAGSREQAELVARRAEELKAEHDELLRLRHGASSVKKANAKLMQKIAAAHAEPVEANWTDLVVEARANLRVAQRLRPSRERRSWIRRFTDWIRGVSGGGA